MQFKTLLTLASVAAVAVAAPNAAVKRANATVTAEATLTTQFTTQTFTATRILQSMLEQDPWVTVITTDTTWTVSHTVTVPVASATARK